MRRAATAFYLLAGIHDKANRAADALREYEKAVALFERLAERDPGDPSLVGYRSISYHVIGRLHVEGGRPEQALDFDHKALAIREQAVSCRPQNKQALSDCAGSWHRLGEALALLN